MRKRINISVDVHTYNVLRGVQTSLGFRSVCELIVAMARILLDRLNDPPNRRHDLTDDDGEYIDAMFDELSNHTRQPDGEVPVRKKRRNIEDI